MSSKACVPLWKYEMAAHADCMRGRAEYFGALLGVVEHLCLPSTQHLMQPLPLLEGGADAPLL